MGLIPGSGRSPGGGHGNPLQYSCLENPMDRGAWWATVQRVAKSQTGLKRLNMHKLLWVLGCNPPGGLWETTQNISQNCPAERRQSWGIYLQTPAPLLLNMDPGVLISLQPCTQVPPGPGNVLRPRSRVYQHQGNCLQVSSGLGTVSISYCLLSKKHKQVFFSNAQVKNM